MTGVELYGVVLIDFILGERAIFEKKPRIFAKLSIANQWIRTEFIIQ